MSVSTGLDAPAGEGREERVHHVGLGHGVSGKESITALGPDLVSRWWDHLPPLTRAGLHFMSTRDIRNKVVNLLVSNVPGPRQRGAIAGAPMTEIMSVGPLTFGGGINITVWSYVDQLTISVLADDSTVEDPHEVTDALRDAFYCSTGRSWSCERAHLRGGRHAVTRPDHPPQWRD